MDRDAIIEKIKKLLRMKRGGTAGEFREEAGATITDWTPFCMLSGDIHGEGEYNVMFYVSFNPTITQVRTSSDELIQVHKVSEVHTIGPVPNLRWLIPMALAHWPRSLHPSSDRPAFMRVSEQRAQ